MPGESEYAYFCIYRLRYKPTENSSDEKVSSSACLLDHIDVQYISHSLQDATNHFDSMNEDWGDPWRKICKYLIKAPLSTKIEEGLINELCIKEVQY